MARLSIIAALLLASGCQNDFSEMYQVDKKINNALVDIAEKEAEKLCNVTDGDFCPVMTRESANSKVMVRQISAAGRAWTTRGTGTKPSYATVLINPLTLTDTETFRLVVRHEMAHTSGCKGHLSSANVMAPTTGEQSAYWTADDVACIRRGLETR
jgi:hypothetical protein